MGIKTGQFKNNLLKFMPINKKKRYIMGRMYFAFELSFGLSYWLKLWAICIQSSITRKYQALAGKFLKQHIIKNS